MKRVYSNKTSKGLYIFCAILAIGYVLFDAVFVVSSINTGQRNLVIVGTIVGCFLLAVTVLNIYVLNRAGCKIVYDPDKNMLYREGLWWGYKYQLKVEDIEEIVVVFLHKDDYYYLLLDPYNTKVESYFKKSYIRLKETKENLEFIKQFWDKPINATDYRGNDGYTKLVTTHRTQK